jgi:ribonucleoside-diphosphate reductase alpha chain
MSNEEAKTETVFIDGLFVDINVGMNLSSRDVEEGLQVIGIDFGFFLGCDDLFRDYCINPCKVTQLEHLPLWALDVLGKNWKDNYGRIKLGTNGQTVSQSRYSRCWVYSNDEKSETRELMGQSEATEVERERGLLFEPAECMFYRIAMACIGVLIHREIASLKKYDGNAIVFWMNDLHEYLKNKAVELFTVMATLRFVPAGRTLKNAGAGKPVVANCVVLDLVKSSLDNYLVLNEALRLQEFGSGVGFPFHCIEPGYANSSKIGAMGFLVAANTFLGCIEEDGRKGANMAIMSVDHPDIIDFIYCKSKSEFALPNFNCSVSLSDRFMKQLEERPDDQWMCQFDGEEYLPRMYTRKSNGMNIEAIKEVPITVKELFAILVERAHCFGDPGCVFLDTVNLLDPSGLPINASNPCGEQFLPSGDVCDLGSLNFDAFFTTHEMIGPSVDMDLYVKAVRSGTLILDCIIDMSKYHPTFRDNNRRNYRRIGLGIMGLADLLYQLRIPYDTEEARVLAGEMMDLATEESVRESSNLARQYGVFASWDKSKWASGYRHHSPCLPMRNVSLTTIPPTGSISMLAGVSSGCEPNFCLAYEQRHILDGKTTVTTYNRRFSEALHAEGLWTEELEAKIIKTGDLSLVTSKDMPVSFSDVFCTAMSISGRAHLLMLIHLQKYTMNAVSKTINLPFEATIEEIGEIYKTAWREGCKGLTVYRDGSRTVQILNKGVEVEEKKEDDKEDATDLTENGKFVNPCKEQMWRTGVEFENGGAESEDGEPEIFRSKELSDRLTKKYGVEVGWEENISEEKEEDSKGQTVLEKIEEDIGNGLHKDIPCRTLNCIGPVVQLTPTCFVCLKCADEGCKTPKRNLNMSSSK